MPTDRRIVYLLAVVATGVTTLVGQRILFSLYALALGANAFEVGLLAAAYQVSGLVLSVPLGVLGDRFGVRWPFVASGALGAAGLLTVYEFGSLTALFAASVLCGAWSTANLVLAQTAIGALSPPEKVTGNFSNFTLVASGCWLFGAPLAGAVIDGAGHAFACLFLVGLAALFLLLTVLGGGAMPPGRRLPAAERARPGRLLAERRLWGILALSAVVQLAADLFPFYLPLHGYAIGLSASAIGVVIGAAHVAAFGVRPVLQALINRFGETPLLAWSIGLIALSMTLIPALDSVVLLVLVAFAFGAGGAVGHPLTTALMFRGSPPDRAGEAMGLRAAANSTLRVAAPPVFGAIAAGVGLPAVFIATGVLLATAAALVARRARRAR